MEWINDPINNIVDSRCITACVFTDPCKTYNPCQTQGGCPVKEVICPINYGCPSRVCPTLICLAYNGS